MLESYESKVDFGTFGWSWEHLILDEMEMFYVQKSYFSLWLA